MKVSFPLHTVEADNENLSMYACTGSQTHYTGQHLLQFRVLQIPFCKNVCGTYPDGQQTAPARLDRLFQYFV